MYKLYKREEKKLDEYWKFIEIFLVSDEKYNSLYAPFHYGPFHYRDEIIQKIRKNYTPEQFYFFERIANKLLWNLIEKINFSIYNIDRLKEKRTYEDLIMCSPVIEIIPEGSSYSHKQVLFNEKINRKYYFHSYDTLAYDTNIVIINKMIVIMSNRKIYNNIMKKRISINKVPLGKYYYYPFDYAFPNINLIFYNENSKEDWLRKINNLYFYNSQKDACKPYQPYHGCYDEMWRKYQYPI
jgi:hypothetical protein